MWVRKGCAVCRTDFAVHPKAKRYTTRQLCEACRRIRSFDIGMKIRKNDEYSDINLQVDV